MPRSPRHPRLSTLTYTFGPGPMTPAVKVLLWTNIALWVASLFEPGIVDWLGLQPQLVIEKHFLWQPVTYMFLHARTPTHILFNMLILWMFGVELERMWGTRYFVKFYGVAGIGAGLTTVLVSLLPFAVTREVYLSNTIGASGALYGLMLAWALYYPNRPILMFLLFPIPAKYFVAILGAIAFVTSIQGGSTIAETTHLGGLLVGYLYLRGRRGGILADIKYRYLKWKMNRMRRKFDVYSGGRSNYDRHVH